MLKLILYMRRQSSQSAIRDMKQCRTVVARDNSQMYSLAYTTTDCCNLPTRIKYSTEPCNNDSRSALFTQYLNIHDSLPFEIKKILLSPGIQDFACGLRILDLMFNLYMQSLFSYIWYLQMLHNHVNVCFACRLIIAHCSYVLTNVAYFDKLFFNLNTNWARLLRWCFSWMIIGHMDDSFISVCTLHLKFHFKSAACRSFLDTLELNKEIETNSSAQVDFS